MVDGYKCACFPLDTETVFIDETKMWDSPFKAKLSPELPDLLFGEIFLSCTGNWYE